MNYCFRQSTLNTLLLCMERGRLDLVDPIEESTDATATGTAFHAGVEALLNGETMTTAKAKLVETFHAETKLPGFRWVKVKTAETCIKHAMLGLDGWVEQVWPKVGNVVAVEESFLVPLGSRGSDTIELSGTIDAVDDSPTIWDWKTAGDEKKYKGGYGGEAWKLRWAIQPAVYTKAWHHLHGELAEFKYAAVTKGTSDFQIHSETRGPEHWAWLEEQCWSLVEFMQRVPQDVVWPKNDQHALCSEKWCPRWGVCKGAHVG